MIFHDRVPVYVKHEHLWELHRAGVAAEVWPLNTDMNYGQATIVVTRYRAVFAPAAELPLGPPPYTVGAWLAITWGDYVFDAEDGMGGLKMDGNVEQHYLRGRLHHYEAIMRSIIA